MKGNACPARLARDRFIVANSSARELLNEPHLRALTVRVQPKTVEIRSVEPWGGPDGQIRSRDFAQAA